MFCTTCSGLFTDPTFDMEVCIWLNSYFWVNGSFKHVDKSLIELFLFRTTSQTNWQTHLFLLFAATGSKVRTGNNSFYTHHKELLCDPVWKRYQLTTGSGLSARLTRPLYGTSQIVTRRDRGAAAVTEKHYNRLPSRKISNLCVIKQQMPGDLICRYSVCNYRTQRKAANPHILEAGMSKCCDFFIAAMSFFGSFYRRLIFVTSVICRLFYLMPAAGQSFHLIQWNVSTSSTENGTTFYTDIQDEASRLRWSPDISSKAAMRLAFVVLS